MHAHGIVIPEQEKYFVQVSSGRYCIISTSPAAGVTVTINKRTGDGGGGASDL